FRGGKMPRAFSDDERVAAEDKRDVVMPSGERATLEVIESELALEVFVGALGSPALHHDADDLLLSLASREGGEHELRGSLFALGPLDHEPHRLAILGCCTSSCATLTRAKAESGVHLATRAVAPGDASKCLRSESDAESLSSDRLAARLAAG